MFKFSARYASCIKIFYINTFLKINGKILFGCLNGYPEMNAKQ